MESKTDKPAPKDDNDSLKTLAMPELMKKLGASPEGLTQAEATKRQAQYGPNQIEEKKTNEYLKFLSYFWGPIPWMIEAAVILSGLVRHWLDFFVILLLLCSNALVGFWEEHQAGNAIAALKARLAIKAKVKRDGKWQDPKASEVVPGDVIRLRLGDIVPADARLARWRFDRSRSVRSDRRVACQLPPSPAAQSTQAPSSARVRLTLSSTPPGRTLTLARPRSSSKRLIQSATSKRL